MTFLRDPAFTAALTFIGLLVPVFIYWRQRSRKRLAYDVVSDTSLHHFTERMALGGAPGKLNLLFAGQPISGATLVDCVVFNAGNTPIHPGDFERPLTLRFGAHAQVLDWELSAPEARDLAVRIRPVAGGLELAPLLLNDGDCVRLKVLVAGEAEPMCVEGHVAGVRRIARQARPGERERRTTYLMRGYILAASVLLELVSGWWVRHHFRVELLVGLTVWWVGIVLAVGLWIERRLDERDQRQGRAVREGTASTSPLR